MAIEKETLNQAVEDAVAEWMGLREDCLLENFQPSEGSYGRSVPITELIERVTEAYSDAYGIERHEPRDWASIGEGALAGVLVMGVDAHPELQAAVAQIHDALGPLMRDEVWADWVRVVFESVDPDRYALDAVTEALRALYGKGA